MRLWWILCMVVGLISMPIGETDEEPFVLTHQPFGQTGVTLSWDSIDDTDGYWVYRWDERESIFEVIADVEEMRYIDKGITLGIEYDYYVQGYEYDEASQKIAGRCSTPVTVNLKLLTPQFTIDKHVNLNRGFGTMKISIKGNYLADGYEIATSGDEEVGYRTVQKGPSSTGYVLLDQYERYYKVRSYKYMEDYTVYSEWSTPRKVDNSYTYYCQVDDPWAQEKYGEEFWENSSKIAWTGCVVSDLAMAFTDKMNKSSYNEWREITPIDVANYLYRYTDQYNRLWAGVSAKGIELSTRHFGYRYEGLKTKQDIIQALKKGADVILTYQEYDDYSHAIIAREYDKDTDMVYIQDSGKIRECSWKSLDWYLEHPSTFEEDSNNGYSYHAIY